MCESTQRRGASPLGTLNMSPCRRSFRQNGFRCLHENGPEWVFQGGGGVFLGVLWRCKGRCLRGPVSLRTILGWRRGVPLVHRWLLRRWEPGEQKCGVLTGSNGSAASATEPWLELPEKSSIDTAVPPDWRNRRGATVRVASPGPAASKDGFVCWNACTGMENSPGSAAPKDGAATSCK